MAQTLVSLLVHVAFSTKNRAKLITPDIEPDLYKYMSGTLRKMESPCLKIGGTANHLHLLVSQSKKYCISLLAGGIEEEFIEMDEAAGRISPPIQMAGWLWRLYHWPIKRGHTQAVH